MNDTKDLCGCCEGTEVLTPLPEANRPGLDRLAYRMGTQASFLESMQARLSSRYLEERGKNPLDRLTTRAPDDAAIAFLDAWATVADVLTFYQERIANEGYLRTATERRSILELARLVGYRLKPGVAASAYLAFTLDKDYQITIPAGTRAQTVPAAGDQASGALPGSAPPATTPPQPFETSADLESRYEWNELKLRLTRPQTITDPSDRLYLKGVSTNLKPNSLLAIEFDSPSTPVAYRVCSVQPDPANDRTLLEIERWDPLPVQTAVASRPAGRLAPLPNALRARALRELVAALGSAAEVSPDAVTGYARKLGEVLLETFASLAVMPASPQRAQAAADTAASLQAIHEALTTVLGNLPENSVAARSLGELAAWTGRALESLRPAIRKAPRALKGRSRRALAAQGQGSPLGILVNQVLEVPGPETIPPRTPYHLPPDRQALLSPTSDLLPQFIAGFYPGLRARLYTAYNNFRVTNEQPRRVYALRLSAAVFGHNALKIPTYQPENGVDAAAEQPPDQPEAPQAAAAKNLPPGTVLPQDQWDEWVPDDDDLPGTLLFLDREYESVVNGGLVAVQVPDQDMQVFRIDRVDNRSRNAYGISGKTSVLDLEGTSTWSDFDGDASLKVRREQFKRFIRGTAVYVQSELLPLAEEPIEETIPDGEGLDTLELDRVYNGLQPGRWIIVSGEVTSLDGTSGVRDSELVMISSVEQTYDPTLPDETPRTRLKLANQLHNTYLRTSVTVYGNVTDATHGETRREVLGSGDASQTFQKFELKQSPLTYLPAPTPSGVESTLEVRVNDVRWAETGNLFQLLGGERGYITRTNDEGKTTVTFGNGRYGARPPTGDENLRALYRSGIGKPGNVAAGQISQLATRPLGVKSVLNPLRSSGGADPESRDSARRNAPLSLLCLDRLVSTQDYADFAHTFAGIGKASAVRVSNGQGELVYLTIAGAEDIPILETSDLYRNLVAAVQRFGDPYQPFTIKVREAVLLVISARVRLDPDYEWASVAPQIRAALLEAFSFEKRELGQDALLSDAFRAFHSVAGVVYVDIDLFDGIPEALANDPEGLAAKMAELAGSPVISPGGSNPEPQPKPRVHIRLRPDENALGPGSLQPAQVAYLSPDIPATLLLEEIP